MNSSEAEMLNTMSFVVTCLMVFAGCSPAQVTETYDATRSNTQVTRTIERLADAKGDWPMFRGNPQSTGVATSTLPEKLEVLWEYEIPKGEFEGSAAIVDVDGQKVVYIGDLDGKLVSLDLATGELRWEYNVESKLGFATSPTYHDGKIYAGDIDGLFHCVDDEGKEVWTYQTNAAISSSANIYKGNVIVGSQDATLYCFDGKNGEVLWEFEAADEIRCTPTIVDGRAFVAGCDGQLHVIDLEKGEEIGKVDIQSPSGGTPAVLGDSVYFGTEQAGFFAVEWATPELKWNFVDEGMSAIRSNPAITEEHVIFGAANRVVRSLNPNTKEENWATTLKTRIETSPVIVGDRVFVSSGDGRLHALKLSTGEIVLEKEFEGGFTASPSVGFGRLIIASDRGRVYCLGNENE